MIRDKANTKKFLVRTLADPVLIYTTVVMMSMMFHYRDKLTVVFGLVTYVIGWVLFRFFDFIKKHSIIGFFAYIFAGISVLRTAWKFMLTGEKDYPIGWSLWFFTPVDAVEYNAFFTYALYTLFVFFMCSVIYYFTRIRYRILMNFLIFIIPFAMYGKEGEKMPTGFIIIMAAGYILLMVCFRPLAENERNTVIAKPLTWASVGVFTLIFAIISTVIPKPEIEANREKLETLVNADELTDRLVKMLSVFQDTSDGTQFRNSGNNSPVYYVNSDNPMHLKTLSYTSYDFATDKWSTSEYDTDSYSVYASCPIPVTGSGNFAEALLYAASADSSFAEKYGLTEYLTSDLKSASPCKIKIYTASRTAEYAPVPQSPQYLSHTTYTDRIATSFSGLLRTDEGMFGPSESYTFEYLPEIFFTNDENRKFAKHLEGIDYSSMTSEASEILMNLTWDSSLSDDEYSIAKNYYDIMSYHNSTIYYFSDSLLDYGSNEQIYNLAQEITEGKETEYEKAKALEMYFYKNGYNYDQKYRKADGENALDFIFDTKTGVCYEYATSMTLLARAVGIPARYCEGFNMTTKIEGEYSQNNYDINYVVTYQDAHGFPELYLKGYGWMSFEPTITDNLAEEEEKSTSGSLAKAGLIILLVTLAGIGAILIYPTVSHKLFIVLCKKRSSDDTVKAVIRRICRLYSVNKYQTSHETEIIVKNISGADISETVKIFDKMVYGGISSNENDKQKALEEYISAYDSLRETKKQKHRQKRA